MMRHYNHNVNGTINVNNENEGDRKPFTSAEIALELTLESIRCGLLSGIISSGEEDTAKKLARYHRSLKHYLDVDKRNLFTETEMDDMGMYYEKKGRDY